MASRIFARKVELRNPRNSILATLPGVRGEANADIWQVTLTDNGVPAVLTGWTAQMQFVRTDGTIQVPATITGNVITVTFPQAAYVYVAKCKAFLWLINASSGVERVVDEIELDVVKGSVGNVIDPGTIVAIPTLNQLLAQLGDTAANADNAALWRAKDGNPATIYPVPKSRLYPKIELVATQSGTDDPSPENIRPILPSLVQGQVLHLTITDGDTYDLLTAAQDFYGLPDAPVVVDAEAGVIRNQTGYIASYDGETVPAGWVSSTGALTTGAQVVYPLAAPEIIPITPPVIAALDRLKRTEARQNVLTATANDSAVGVQKQTVTYQKSPIRESDEIAAVIEPALVEEVANQ